MGRDWVAARLGPAPTEALVQLAQDAFLRLVAVSGAPVALFTDADGTSQRESMRRWHLTTVLPIAKLIEHELSMALDAPVSLEFDSYALDMVSRAQVVSKLTSAGVGLGVAMSAVGLDQ